MRPDKDSRPAASGSRSPARKASRGKAEKSVARSSQPRKTAAKQDPFPRVVDAELATLVRAAPEGDDWLHEIKFDGYRMIAVKDEARVRFETRNHLDWTSKVPDLAEAIGGLKVRRAIFDGEVVAFDKRGITEFQLLQNAFRDRQAKQAVYVVFDLLYLDGVDLRGQPLDERKATLAGLKLPTDRGPLRVSEFVIGSGAEFFAHARRAGLEGVVSKRRTSPYRAGRNTDWIKTKCLERSEFVIGGFTDPGGSRHGFGSLLLGVFDDDQRLTYAGRVGTGFSHGLIDELAARLSAIERPTSPFVDARAAARLAGVHWVRPQLVAQVAFSNWTRDHRLRHPSFQGLREDKPPRLVHAEKPVPIALGASAGRKHGHASRRAPSVPTPSGDEATLAGVRITHPDRLLYPAEKITKRELAEYYLAVAERMLPEVAGRPLAIVRCPDGVTGSRFFQKHPPTAAPKNMHRVEIREKSGTATYLTIEDVGDLVGLVQIAALEIHVWGSRVGRLEKPDRVIFDLDPAPDVQWPVVVAAACELREFLEALGLVSFAKISGGKGVHLVVPIRRTHDWPQVADFSRAVAQAVERAAPDRYTAVLSKRARVGKIFIDYLRNQRGATSIASYSTRVRDGAPVAAPVSWRELSRIHQADPFNVRSMLTRLRAMRNDPWQGIGDVSQSITQAMLRQLH
jgi:bifunctional non-homologous end joining protein LigD